MAKVSGLGDNLYVDGIDLSGDVGSLSKISGGFATQNVTGIDKSAHERLGLLRNGEIDFGAFFNTATGQAHVNLSTLPTTNRRLMYCRGTTIGGPAANMVGKQIDYALTRADSGALTVAVSAVSDGFGLEWGTQLTAGKRTDTTATNGTAVDFGAASSFGLQAYLHVFTGFAGTSVTVKLQESSDNGADAYTDVVGGAFSAAASIQTQRIATSAVLAVERYLRVVTTGTFSNAVFAVSVARNLTATAF